jgi:hypothetical protein
MEERLPIITNVKFDPCVVCNYFKLFHAISTFLHVNISLNCETIFDTLGMHTNENKKKSKTRKKIKTFKDQIEKNRSLMIKIKKRIEGLRRKFTKERVLINNKL